jgi:hypothetical protein
MKAMAVLVACWCAVTGARAGVLDQAAYDAAFAKARAAKKPVVVMALAPSWDEASGKLEAAANEPAFAGWLAQSAVVVRLDPSQEGDDHDARPFAAAQMETLGIKQMPLLALYQADGVELGRVAFEAQSGVALRDELSGMAETRSGYRERLARMKTEGPVEQLADAAYLLKYVGAQTLGTETPHVAQVIFEMDLLNTTGQRPDAALILSGMDGRLTAAATAYLESIAPNDPEKRFAFVAFIRTAQSLSMLMMLRDDVKAGRAKPEVLRRGAVELVSLVNRARPFAPDDAVRAQLLARAAVALKLAGEVQKAEAALAAAKSLAARAEAQQNVESAPQLAAAR